MAARKAPAAKGGKSRVSRVPVKSTVKTDSGAVNSRADLNENVSRGAGPTVPGRNKPVSRPSMKSPKVTKAAPGSLSRKANAVASRGPSGK